MSPSQMVQEGASGIQANLKPHTQFKLGISLEEPLTLLGCG